MINEPETIEDFTETSNRKRPVLLTVLIVLSGIYITGNLLGVINS